MLADPVPVPGLPVPELAPELVAEPGEPELVPEFVAEPGNPELLAAPPEPDDEVGVAENAEGVALPTTTALIAPTKAAPFPWELGRNIIW